MGTGIIFSKGVSVVVYPARQCLTFLHKVFEILLTALFLSRDKEVVQIPIETAMAGKTVEIRQDDPLIKKYILSKGFLHAPSKEPYNLQNPNKDPSVGQAEMIRKLLRFQRGGFFVEAGALDGEVHSNTLYLEKALGWKGLLIEPSPKNFAMLKNKGRKAWTANCGLSTKPYPHEVILQENFNVSQIVEQSQKIDMTGNGYHRHPDFEGGDEFVTCQCFPLYSILSALNVKTVDYLSLDVEGVEYEILETIPFDKIFIKAISVEFSHVPVGKEGLRNYLESKGYVLAGELARPIEPDYANDFIFIHKTFSHLIPKDPAELMPDYLNSQ